MSLVAVTAKGPRRQISPHPADLASFWEIAPGVVARVEDQRLGLAATHLSLQRGYPVHAPLQDWMPGIGMRVWAPVWKETAAEGWIGSTPPVYLDRSYPRRSPCSPTYLPHRQTARLLPGLSACIGIELTQIRQRHSAMLRTCELPSRESE